MDKDRSSIHGGSLLPPPPPLRRNSGYSSSGNVKPEPPPSPGLPPLAPGSGSELSGFGHGMCSNSDGGRRFSSDIISKMPDNPPKTLGHRRAHSEILTLPDDINFDSDLGLLGGFDGPSSFSDDTDEDLLAMYLDMDKFASSSCATSALEAGESSSSVAAAAAFLVTEHVPGENMFSEDGIEQKTRVRRNHQHSLSMDGSMTIKPEMLMSGIDEESALDAKKSMSAAKLAELALVDPKRAKRIWANRQSAARSKERKMRYISELERKVQTLQTEATTLSAQFTLLQRDTNGLNVENSELKLRVQTMEQQVHLQDALNEALKDEIQHLKVVTGQAFVPNGGQMMMNYLPSPAFGGVGQQFYNNNNNNNHLLAARQFQQLQIHSQKQHQQQFQQIQQQQLQQQQMIQQQEQQDPRMIRMNSPPCQTQKQNANASKD
ncbi:probable transcription factor PosF21 [Impatiens glandulifera]|uniref:probable transcription factor PosF21 n=1 Tax=Impatiens glandulifera TaxID=253017 RepID=UPI001FB0B8D1|nr:probable transcription factor PosF21 [Impatiens glandulifera]